MSFLKGFFSLFDWMSPKTLDASLEGLDESLQHLYDKMNWGKYQAYPTSAAWNMSVDVTSKISPPQQIIYAYRETFDQLIDEKNKGGKMKLTDEEIFIIQLLLQDKLEEVYNGPEGIEVYWKTDVMEKLLKKLDNL